MKLQHYVPLLVVIVLSALLYGCGAGGTSPSSKDAHSESVACISCHQDASWKTPATGQNVVAEWRLSVHNTKNGASCGDCHGTGANHPATCNKCHTTGVAFNPLTNPDASNKCADCHDSTKGYNTASIYDGKTTNTLTEHFSTPTLKAYTSGIYPARFVSKNYETKCRSCHNPHDTSSNMEKLRQWARSGKGDVTAAPWTNYDFGRDPSRSTATPGATPANSFGSDCVRCHTATGHINFLTSGSIAAPYGGTSKTGGKEVLACNTCHVNYSYVRRTVPQVTAYYNKSTVSKYRIRIPVTYPDVGESNLCLNCHVGRENGKVIKELANSALTSNKVITPTASYNFANAGFENSHYLTAGATIFRTSGFEFYSSQYYDNPSFYGHDKIGVANYNNTGTSGPCITCHMKPGRHTFLPVKKDGNNKLTSHAIELTSPVCNNASCHAGSMSATEIEHQKELFHAAMTALEAIIEEKLNIFFATTNPYFFTTPFLNGYIEKGLCSNNLAVKNWQTGGKSIFTPNAAKTSCTSKTDPSFTGLSGTGNNNMGAAFNFNLLHHDYGAFAHNRFYTKRLIYDSISWLSDNNVKSTTNNGGYFSDVEAAIQDSTILTAQQKSDACNYLFSSRTYTYAPKSSNNWRPGSSSSIPIY